MMTMTIMGGGRASGLLLVVVLTLLLAVIISSDAVLVLDDQQQRFLPNENNIKNDVMTIATLLPFTQGHHHFQHSILQEEDEDDDHHDHKGNTHEHQGERRRTPNIHNDAAALWIAMEDWNHEHSTAENINSNCTIQIQLEFLDSQGSRVESTNLVNNVLLPRASATCPSPTTPTTYDAPRVDGILAHDIYSQMTSPVAILAGNQPQIPFLTTSTMEDLRSKKSYPTVGRSMAGNTHLIAQELYSNFWNATHIAVLYGRDLFGKASTLKYQHHHTTSTSSSSSDSIYYPFALLPSSEDENIEQTRLPRPKEAADMAASSKNHTSPTKKTPPAPSTRVRPIPFVDDEESLQQAMKDLKSTKIRTIYVVCQTYQFQMILEEATRQNLVGENYQWLFHGPDVNTIHDSGLLKVHQQNRGGLATALKGVGILSPVGDGVATDPFLPDIPREPPLKDISTSLMAPYENFRRRWRTTVAQDTNFYNKLFANLPINATTITTTNDTTFYPEPPTYAPFLYDTVWSFGLSMCAATTKQKRKNNKERLEGDDSSRRMNSNNTTKIGGVDIMKEFRKVDFTGPSGRFSVDPKDTVRRHQDHVVWNILQLPPSESESEDSTSTTQFGIYPSLHLHHHHDPEQNRIVPIWKTLRPFQFTSKEVPKAPASTPPIEWNQYASGKVGRIVAYSIMSITIILAILSLVWMHQKRKERAVRASQPIFLTMISVGSIITSLALIPLGIDDTIPGITQQGLDISCNAVLWLYIVGIVCSWSALTAKARGVYEIYRNPGLDCVLVSARDLIYWCTLALSVNLALLIIWSVVAPWKFVRLTDGTGETDEWGRPVDSYSVCVTENPRAARAVIIPLICFNFLAVGTGCWWAWQTRNVETEYKESRYVGLALAFTLQSWLLGFPLVLITWETSDTRFYVSLGIIFVSSIVGLATIYIPKMYAISTDRRIQCEYKAKVKAQMEKEEKRLRREARHSTCGDYPKSHDELVHTLHKENGDSSHGQDSSVDDDKDITWSSDVGFPSAVNQHEQTDESAIRAQMMSLSRGDANQGSAESSNSNSLHNVTRTFKDGTHRHNGSNQSSESGDDDFVVLAPPQLKFDSSLGLVDPILNAEREIHVAPTRRPTLPTFAVQADSLECDTEDIIEEDRSIGGMTISTTKTRAPVRGIRISFNPRSQRNLALTGGRELSRQQMFHLFANGEYVDESDGIEISSDRQDNTILPMTNPTTTAPPSPKNNIEGDRLRSVQEEEDEEYKEERRYEEYSVELN